MTIMGYTHVAMELWGVIFSLIAALCIYTSRDFYEKTDRILRKLFLSNAILLFSDAFAWIFRGYSGIVGKYIVHISNFIVFIMGYIMLLIFTEYLVPYIGQETKEKRLWRKLIWMLVSVACISVIVSQYNHMYYYFDAGNVYHRGSAFFITQVFGIVGSLINTVMLVRCRGKIEKNIFLSFMSYILLPFLAMIIQIFIYGISLLNIAITISVLWMFVIFQMDKGKRMKKQGEQLLKQAELLVAQEHELNNMQRKIMLSQI